MPTTCLLPAKTHEAIPICAVFHMVATATSGIYWAWPACVPHTHTLNYHCNAVRAKTGADRGVTPGDQAQTFDVIMVDMLHRVLHKLDAL